MSVDPLGIKQALSHEAFVDALATVPERISRADYERAVDVAADRVRMFKPLGPTAFGWSGGKDSLALEAVCRRAGVEDCVLGITTGLEYPAFLAWVTDHMPDGLTVVRNGWDLAWLAKHPHMLFPQKANIAGTWFRGVQRRCRIRYSKQRGLRSIMLGRRTSDGNYIGKGDAWYYQAAETGDTLQVAPIHDWSHDMVLASLIYDPPAGGLPPFYAWPRGFRVGTHPWPQRQWCPSVAAGYAEVFSIDPSLVHAAAAAGVAGAAEYLAGRNG